MKSIFVIFVFVALVFSFQGCSGNSDSAADSRDRLSAKASKRLRKRREQAKANSSVSEEAKAKLPARSVEDLVSAFKLAFAAGDTETLKAMTHVENLTPDNEKYVYAGAVGIKAAGVKEIEEVEILDLEEHEYEDYWSLRPEKVLKVSARSGRSGSRWKQMIVFVDGAYYFYGCARPSES